MPKIPSPTQIPDEMILAWMDQGLMYVEDWLTAPRLIFRGRELKPQLNAQGGRGQVEGGDRYRYHLRWDGKQRMVMRSKIVWMYVRGRIPSTHRVHHGDRGRHADDYLNLDCWTDEQHELFHHGEFDEVPF